MFNRKGYFKNGKNMSTLEQILDDDFITGQIPNESYNININNSNINNSNTIVNGIRIFFI